MDIVNSQVRHNKYGIGDVVGQADNTITVQFTGDSSTKKFFYPSIFENYMTLCSQELQEQQMAEIVRHRDELQAAILQRTAEEEQRKLGEKPAVKSKSRTSTAGTKTARRKVSDKVSEV